ncbi:MAG: hypothetical protein KA957_00345 [Syntrophaceae bacterium]|nr:hypothetical protein [Syntrophaceae bacterium]
MFANKIVVHYADGRTKKGSTNNFDPGRDIFHLTPPDAPPESLPLEIHLSDLKAVFFVRSFEGHPNFYPRHDGDGANKAIGRRVTVRFKDGETMKGVTTNINPDRLGFFLQPIDPQSNIERCFVVKQATNAVILQ